MAIKSGIFNSVNGDRRYKAEDFANYFAKFIGNGVFPNPSNGFQVIANSDMTVSLKAGNAWIYGYYATNDDDYTMALDVADGVLNRIDRVVLRLNYLNRSIVPLIKKGTFASAPSAPALKRDADAYEIALADIRVNKGVLSITQANITDTRLNKDLCGIVHGTVDQVDTTTIFNQYQAALNEFSIEKQGEFNQFTDEKKTEFNDWKSAQELDYSNWSTTKKAEFDDWFITIQNILSGDVAGNLLNKIIQIESTLDAHQTDNVIHVTLAERNSWNTKETPEGARKTVEQNDFKVSKSNKDSNGVFTTVQYRRNDGKLAISSVLSGGTSPLYTTRTINYYGTDGTTIEKTTVRTLTYDSDDLLISEV